jgi:2-keto-4-pentenoate hydratase/2-oxohepta-3-ene-1,7-dioic acid hydratase in catechol pathway
VKIARFQNKGKEHYGVIQNDRLWSLDALPKSFNRNLPRKIEDFISNQTAQKTAEKLFSEAKSSDLNAVSIRLDEARLLAPIASPPKILCLGLNFQTHVIETNEKRPEEPVVFVKPRTAIVGPNDRIIKRPFVKELDYEGELAIVMGKKAKDVPVSEALNNVFGYTILNDVSARDFQFRSSQWTLGKGFDTFAPIGPCITTRNQLPDPDNLNIKTWVNSELRQDGNTHDMIFSVAQIVHHLSRVMTLEPCDIIAAGTPSGVAMAMKTPKWLKADDSVRIEIDGIGTLENTVQEM